MKTIMEKLRRNRGETLIESLCAILVIALIGAGFCASVMAVVKITARVRAQDDQFYSTTVTGSGNGTATVNVGGTNYQYTITYTHYESGLVDYAKAD
ncbi:MAG TPA: type II secretion system protein [Oscillospiraceae bacterium]|nr:type II secretion system protein [Oscillospiraceae bacterium]HNW05292.1 type II secretion system protein [Oscillospiraceae bacterium]